MKFIYSNSLSRINYCLLDIKAIKMAFFEPFTKNIRTSLNLDIKYFYRLIGEYDAVLGIDNTGLIIKFTPIKNCSWGNRPVSKCSLTRDDFMYIQYDEPGHMYSMGGQVLPQSRKTFFDLCEELFPGKLQELHDKLSNSTK